MSTRASGSTTLTLVPEIGTFNQYLVCDKGELRQDYEGSPSNPGKVNPDFTVNPRTLTLYVSSSRAAGSEIPDKVTFYINSVEIGSVTKGSGSTYSKVMSTNTDFVKTFELLDPTQNSGNYGLRIKHQLVPITLGESGMILAEFIVSEGTSSATLSTDFPFRLSEVVSNSTRTVIEAGDAYNFQITPDNATVKLVARFYRGLSEVTSGLAYKWYRQVYGANPAGGALRNWQELVGKTAQQLEVSEGDVDSSQLYMVHVFDAAGTFLGQDTQRVDDRSDLYEIGIKRTPEDGQVHKPGDEVLLEATVYRRTSSTPVTLPSTAAWNFIGTTPAGTTIFDKATGNQPKAKASYQEIFDAGGQLEVMASVEF